jgi:hypothetical protein
MEKSQTKVMELKISYDTADDLRRVRQVLKTIEDEHGSAFTVQNSGEENRATCLFTACPSGDGFSAAPEQNKEFMFMKTEHDRLLIRPTNMVLFEERSFTTDTGWPTDIATASQVWNCE